MSFDDSFTKKYVNRLIENDVIEERLKVLGEEISNYYQGDEFVAVCVLKGAMCFFINLCSNINGNLVEDFIKVKSYNGTKREAIKPITMPTMDVKGKKVLIVEDIVDSGYTLDYLVNYYINEGAKDVKTAVLLDKHECRKIHINPDFVGFSVPDEFIVGYGLDYNEYFRNLDYIGYIPKELIKDFIKDFESKEHIRILKK